MYSNNLYSKHMRQRAPFSVPVPAFCPTAAYALGTKQTALHSPTVPVYFPLSSTFSGGQKMELVKQAVQPAKSNAVVYIVPGLRGTVRVAKGLIVGEATDRFDALTFATPAAPKAKLTPEERKAARAAAPKLTEEQKIVRDRTRLAAREAKLAAKMAAKMATV